MKKILITGKDSYIGTQFESYLKKFGESYKIDTVDMIGDGWKNVNFGGYDAVFHVAGIAHRKETKSNRYLYYDVNCNLAVEVANKALNEGVKLFVYLSSMSVYGLTEGIITEDTVPNPITNYGKSKLLAEQRLHEKLDVSNTSLAILRPPMVYGDGCKGNYSKLCNFAKKTLIFPNYKNQRSMVSVDVLCEYVKIIIDKNLSGLFFPQDKDYVCTAEMVRNLSVRYGRKIYFTKLFNPIIRVAKIGIVKKIFGNLVYDIKENI